MNFDGGFLRKFGFLFILVLIFIGCDSSDSQRLKAATYNAGLAVGFVDHAQERAPVVADAIAGLDADVVCLQEVWLPEQYNAIIAAAEGAFPFSYLEVTRADSASDSEASCGDAELDALLDCIDINCSGIGPGGIGGCVLANCGTEFAGTSADCQACLAANLGQTTEDIVAACTTGAGGNILYDGHNGLLLLSKYPLDARQLHVLDSFLVRRAVLKATIPVEGFSPVDVYCTHLSAAVGGVPYNGDFVSWEAEQGAQIDDMLAYIGQTTPAGRKVVLMGDMNTGPQTARVEAEFEANFAKFGTAGFWSPYLAEADHQCTWCSENPLIGGGDDSIIDHVLLYNFPAHQFTINRRILDQPIEVTVDGDTVTTRLSDHYGARTEIWN